jgi:pimeloyl-ACP methyl ester carboxylesterase
VATFEESPCPFDIPEGAPVECGFVVVPEDHDNPAGPTIRLAVATFRDQSDDHQPDPVLLLAGGPGERIVGRAAVLAQFLAPIYPNRDLIAFDQRGVGLSEPALECPEFVESLFDILDEPDPNAAMKTIFDAILACRDRLVAEGHNLSAFNTVQNAADVNAIRVALGYDEINLYGGSYGSLLAQAAMRDHPEGIRSVAVNSVLPLEKSLFVEAATTTSTAIMRLLDACAADEACDAAYPNLEEKLFEVIDRLNDEPIPVSLTNPLDGRSYDAVLTGETVTANLVTFLYLTQIIPALPQAVDNLYEGDFGLITQLSSTRLGLLDLMSRGMTFSVMCTEDLIGYTPEDLLRVAAALPPQLAKAADPDVDIKYGVFGVCENWPVEEAGPWVKEPLASDIPTLVLEGEFDPVTPPEYGQLLADNLTNSYYFEFPGIGHDVIVASECARIIAGAFLDDPTQDPRAACFDEMPGVVFDLPAEHAELVLEPFTDDQRGFTGLLPAGWQELAPANLLRGNSAFDLTYFVLEASTKTAPELLAILAGQLDFDPEDTYISTGEMGNFTWDFHAFERRGLPADLAMTEGGGKSYFVFMVSAATERDVLHEQLFLPAVKAMAPLE